ncbi:unnamed protein product [Urochloa humidicola]
MELDLLGLGLPPAMAAAAVVHGGSAGQRPGSENAGSDESPLRLAAATEASSPARGRMRRHPAVDADGGGVADAPPANRLKQQPPSTAAPPWPAHPPPSSRKVRVPGAAGDGSPRASQLVFFRGVFPPAPGDLAAAHAIAASAPPLPPPPLLGISAPAANGFGRPPPFAGGPIFEGSAAASSSSDPDHPTAPLTIIYAGSVRAFDSIPVKQAEKILYMTAKEAQAAETPSFQHPEPADAIPSSSAAQMMMLLGLANANDSLLPKRTASLARFLQRRKQRVERAAAMPYPCGEGEVLPAQQMDPSTAAYARDIQEPWTSEDGPKSMKENHGEEAVNTDLKM